MRLSSIYNSSIFILLILLLVIKANSQDLDHFSEDSAKVESNDNNHQNDVNLDYEYVNNLSSKINSEDIISDDLSNEIPDILKSSNANRDDSSLDNFDSENFKVKSIDFEKENNKEEKNSLNNKLEGNIDNNISNKKILQDAKKLVEEKIENNLPKSDLKLDEMADSKSLPNKNLINNDKLEDEDLIQNADKNSISKNNNESEDISVKNLDKSEKQNLIDKNINLKSNIEEALDKKLSNISNNDTISEKIKSFPQDFQTFIYNETKVLLLPPDDVVLGKIVDKYSPEVMDGKKYIRLAEKRYDYLKDLGKSNKLKQVIRRLESKNNDIRLSYNQSREMILNATKNGDIDKIRSILDYSDGNIINVVNKKGDSLLHISALSGNYFVSKYLLIRGADINKTNKMCFSPLDTAIINNLIAHEWLFSNSKIIETNKSLIKN